MTTFQKLKHEARRAEQRSDWRKAIALYREAMRHEERRGGPVELGLYNRVGDLHVRLGEVLQAVECYEQAAERYAENELPTSAVALCNKILRVAPGHTDVFRRLGLLHASTGLLAEARSATLQYIDRMEESGKLAEAIEALQEFVNRTGDEGFRVQVADLLQERGHRDQALAQFRLATIIGRDQGRNTAEIERRIAELEAMGFASEPVPAEATPPGPAKHPHAETRASDGPEASEEVPGVAERAAPIRLDVLIADALSADDGSGIGFELAEQGKEKAEEASVDPGHDELSSVLSCFRARIGPELNRAGAAGHYDLGVAFQGMGLQRAALDELRAGISADGRLDSAHERITALLGGEARTSEPAAGSSPRLLEAVTERGEPGPEPDRIEAVDGGEIDGTQPYHPEADQPGDEESLGPDLQGLFFRARLAQYQIRRAQDAGRTDHRSHLDLGAAYSAMGLAEESVRELYVALDDPGKVGSRAVSLLLELAREPSTERQLSLSILERLGQAGHGSASAPIRHELAGRWSEDHPGADRLGRMPGWVEEAPEAGAPAAAESAETVPSEGESLEVLDELLEQLEAEPAANHPATRDGTDAAILGAEAEEMLSEGRVEEATTRLFRALEVLEDARDIGGASHIVDRLLQLRPDDVVLHHQRAEFALSLDDREMLLASYMGLASTLRRQQAPASARTVYARILDIDPEHLEAREALEQLSSGVSVQQPGTVDLEPVSGTRDDATEFDSLLEDLRDPGPGEDAFDGDAEAHFELGIAFKQMEMWDEALAELELAAGSREDPAPVWEAMAECLQQAGRPDEALEILTRAEDHPAGLGYPNPGVLYRLALLLHERGDAAGAADRLRRVVQIDPGFRDAASRLSALSP